ncbi:hypothetical protein ACWC9X_16350, partial [Streptomyces asoensis]
MGASEDAVTWPASEIEALNAGSIDIGWIGPSPAINGYTKSPPRAEQMRLSAGFPDDRRVDECAGFDGLERI